MEMEAYVVSTYALNIHVCMCIMCSCMFLNDYQYAFLYLPTECRDGDILLYNGTTLSTEHSNGTVLVCYDNEYGTVCDDFWDTLDAMVVCTHLGFDPTGNQITFVNHVVLLYMITWCAEQLVNSWFGLVHSHQHHVCQPQPGLMYYKHIVQL